MAPKMILFDYGQTLVHETDYDPIRGAQALIDAARCNPRNATAQDIVQLLEAIKRDILAEFQAPSRSFQPLELSAVSVNHYILQYLGLEYDISGEELEWIFWDNATPAIATEHIGELLEVLNTRGIATGVVSNLMNTGRTLERRLSRLLPGQRFSFVLSSCDYVFRKPHPRIFDMALHLAALPPEEIWFCGDNLRCDVIGAHNAGMRPFWYTKYLRAHSNDLFPDYATEIRDWRALIEIMKLE